MTYFSQRLLLVLLLLPAMITQPAGAHAQAVPDARVRYTINDGWKFLPGGVEFAEKASVPDAGWESVNLPHTWNAADPFDDTPGYRRGIGWYRKNLRLADELRGKRLFLYFEGANQVADVYVNGAFAGRHRGGYTAFAFDVTRYLKFDGQGNENLVAVQVDNSHSPFIPPLSVGFALYGGIYRDVWLIATDPVHLEVTDHASPGVFVSTPKVSREQGEVAVRGAVLNDGPAAKQLRVVNSVTDSAGNRVTAGSSMVRVPAGGRAEFQQRLNSVRNPRLWSPDRPYLYTVTTEVWEGEVLRDRISNPLGFRWFRFDPAQGFFLNGEKLVLRGTNRHQDYAGRGSAISDQQHVRDLQLIKKMGANFLRLAHYPQDPAVLDAADRLGLLVWEEIPVVNYITPSEEFTRNSETMLREMIRQHHNHPSVVVWGTMNEVFLWSPEGARISRQTDTTYTRKVRDYAVRLDRLARQEDPARSTAMAIHGSPDYDKAGVSDIAQVLGLNVYSGWYGGEFPGFGNSLDNRHARSPNQVIFVSEYGSGSDLRLNALQPERFDHSSAWHRMYHESYLRQTRERPYLAGTAIWNQFDFSQPFIGESMPNMNQKGMLTFDRRPKDVYYMYKANWNPEPMVHIASRDWTRRAGTGPLPVTQPVDVYSNLPRVELIVNGVSLGVREPNDVRSAHWDAPLVAGDNSIVARGERDGRPYVDQLTVHLEHYPQELRTAPDFRELAVNVGSNAQYVDEDGVIWVEDQAYRPGSFGYVGGERKLHPRDVVLVGSHRTGLLVTYREGLREYRFDAPDGEYDVELAFAEPTRAGPGERVFAVAVNGRTILPRLDLPAQEGAGRALPLVVRTIATGGEGVRVAFQPIAGEPILNAIRVVRR